MYVNRGNPILSTHYCYAGKKIIVKLSTEHGKKVHGMYKNMSNNFKKNIKEVYNLLHMLVYKSGDSYHLKDITAPSLQKIIEEAKRIVSFFYIQSLVDFQNLLDEAEKLPKVDTIIA